MKPFDLSERFLVYMIEQSFLISTTSLILYSVNIKARLLGLFLVYKVNFVKGITLIFTTNSGLINLLVLFQVSFLYYSLETLTNMGLAEVR